MHPPSWLLLLQLLLSMAVSILTFPYYEEDMDAIKRMLNHPQMDTGELSKAALDEYFYRLEGMKNHVISPSRRASDPAPKGTLKLDLEWPAEYVTSKLGQIGGIDTSAEGHAYVFHRASRTWDSGMFNEHNEYTKKEEGPIQDVTLIKMDKLDGKTLQKSSFLWSANRFYMPHGLTVDHDQNIWLTDVATHQVFKFPAGASEPSLVLGKAFEPANGNKDTERLCKPTAVAVASNGDFFVADGYCNSRVIKYSSNGTILGMIVEDFEVPHDLALLEEQDLICVADRENERIVCLRAGLNDNKVLGEPVEEFSDFNLGRVFSIAYSPKDCVMYAVTQASYGMELPMCYTIFMDEDRPVPDLMVQWTPEDSEFDQPHAVAVTPDGKTVYVGIIDHESQRKVWKFDKPKSLAEQTPEEDEE